MSGDSSLSSLRGHERGQLATALALRLVQEHVSIHELAREVGWRPSLVRRCHQEVLTYPLGPGGTPGPAGTSTAVGPAATRRSAGMVGHATKPHGSLTSIVRQMTPLSNRSRCRSVHGTQTAPHDVSGASQVPADRTHATYQQTHHLGCYERRWRPPARRPLGVLGEGIDGRALRLCTARRQYPTTHKARGTSTNLKSAISSRDGRLSDCKKVHGWGTGSLPFPTSNAGTFDCTVIVVSFLLSGERRKFIICGELLLQRTANTMGRGCRRCP